MRILYLSASIIPSRMANSIHVMKMCQAFAHHDHQVTLLARTGESISRINQNDFTYYGVAPCFEVIKYRIPAIRVFGSFIYMLLTLGVVLRRQPDLIYARHVFNLAAVAKLNIPMILEVHDLPSSENIKNTIAWLLRRPQFVQLVTISQVLAYEYRQLYPDLPQKKVQIAHDGADLPLELGQPSLIADWPGRPQAVQVGYTGHLYAGRGIELLLTLAQQMPEVDFHLVGGTEEDLARWRKFSNSQNIFFHGYIQPSQVRDYVTRFDIVLAPYQRRIATAAGRDTTRWMSPLKLFEYMAMSKPIICSDLPVIHEIPRHDETALLVPPEDIQAWYTAITVLSGDPALRARLGKNAFTELAKNYTWSVRAAKVLRGLPGESTCTIAGPKSSICH